MPEMNEPLAVLKNISLKSDGLTILDNVSLTIPAGEIVTLIGPNGAGKTSLLKIILGIIPPTSGEIIRKKGLAIGYVPQKISISTAIPLSVERFLNLGRTYPADDLNRVLEETHIPHLLYRDIHPLSGGEMQRVLLARALLQKPALLVLDEPAQGLDPVGEEKFYALLYHLNKERGCAILMVSHDLHVVMANTHQVICLNRHICCRGRPDEIISLPGYASLFGDRHSHLALYTHQHTHAHEPDGRIKHAVE